MADENPGPSKGANKFLFILIPLALVAIGAGAALPWLFGKQATELIASDNTGKSTAFKKQAAIPFDDVVVNLGDGKFNQFLRVKLMLAVEEKQAREVTDLVAQQKPFLKSWLICYLSDQTVQDVSRRSGVNRLRREICDQFNVMLYPGGEEKVLDVLFDMFVVQQ